MNESEQPAEVEAGVGAGPEPAVISATGSFEDQERAVGIDPDAPLPGEGGMRIILFGAIALFGIPAVLGAGIAAGYPVIGIVLALALGAVCVLFARPRRRA